MSKVFIKRIKESIYLAVEEVLQPWEKRLISKGERVLLKPNLVEPRPYTTGATTNPYLVEAVVNWCYAQGARTVAIGEGPSYFQPVSELKECFKVTGILEVAERTGASWILFDEHPFVTLNEPLHLFRVSRFAFEFDKIINLPVPKTHYLTGVSIAMKNLKGFLKREDKPRFHHAGLGIHLNIVELNRIIKPSLNIVDVTAPVQKNSGFILAGEDIVAIDTITTSLMGFNPWEIQTIVLGYKKGLGEMDIQKIEVAGDDLRNLKLNFEFPEAWLKRNFPMLQLVGIEEACSGCMLPLINLLSQYEREKKKVRRKLSILLGKKTDFSKDGECIALGDCTEGKVEKERHLKGCPPHKDEVAAFLKRYFEE